MLVRLPDRQTPSQINTVSPSRNDSPTQHRTAITSSGVGVLATIQSRRADESVTELVCCWSVVIVSPPPGSVARSIPIATCQPSAQAE